MTAPALVRLVFLSGAMLLSLSSCRFIPVSQPRGTHMHSVAAPRAAVLVIVVDEDSRAALRATGALAAASVRPGERLVVLGARSGAILASGQAPSSASIEVPARPDPLPSDATSFQKARHAQAVRQYQDILDQARAALLVRQRQELTAWVSSFFTGMLAQITVRSTRNISMRTTLDVAAAYLSSLRQGGLGSAAGIVIAIMGVDAVTARTVPAPLTGLQESTVVVDNFPGGSDEESAWQASLLQGGAARAVLLTPATSDQFVPIVRQGLDGAVTDTLTSMLFARGQYRLQGAALPQLRRLLHLLTVVYRHATATVNGYTDSLPAPGGNLQLSRQRAQEVEQWLTRHGVAAGRLQAFGYGDTDPIARNTPTGQPLNRRVVVVIDPAVSA